jgi:CRP/FNR family transcriptional regulator, anaerobic regulatory protein
MGQPGQVRKPIMPCRIPSKCKVCSLYYDAGNFCAKLDARELRELNASSQTETIRRGDEVWDQVLDRWPIFAIESGVMSLQHLLSDGRRTIAAFFMRGDIIDMRNSANRKIGSLIALSDVGICRLSPKIFEKIVGTNEKARLLLWENLREQNFRAFNHSTDLAKKQAQEKLASFIFECSHRNPQTRRGDHVDIPIRRRDMAEYLGMQPETVSRCFKILADKQVIRVTDLSIIQILNAPALRQIANGARPDHTRAMTAPVEYKILTSGP